MKAGEPSPVDLPSVMKSKLLKSCYVGRSHRSLGPGPDSFQWARPFGLVLLAAFVFLAGYEFVERTWLKGLEPGMLQWLRPFRSIGASVLAAGIVCRAVLRKVPQTFVPLSLSEMLTLRSHTTRAQRLKNSLRWFIGMRWLAMLLVAALTLVGTQVFEWLPPEAEEPLGIGLIALGLSNGVYTFLIHHRSNQSWLLGLQGYCDLVLLVLLLHFSGGWKIPCPSL